MKQAPLWKVKALPRSDGAKVGQVIVGNLGRGAGGRFTRVGGPGMSGINKLLNKYSEPKKGKKGSSKKVRPSQADQEKLASDAGLPAESLRNLQAFAKGGDLSPEAAQSLRNAGLLKDIEGKPTLAPNTRGLLAALGRGDARGVNDALVKAGAALNKANKPKKVPKAKQPKQPKAPKLQDPQKTTDALDVLDARLERIDRTDSWASNTVTAVSMRNKLNSLLTGVDKLDLNDAGKAKLKKRIQATLARLPKPKTQDGEDPTQDHAVSSVNDTGGKLGGGQQRFTHKELKSETGILVFKSDDFVPKYRWVTYSTNAFKDREREIVSTEALYKSVERMDARSDYGPLRFWHLGEVYLPPPDAWDTAYALKGVDLGICDYSAVHGRVLIESGTFKNAVIAEAVMKNADSLEVSAGFTHPPGEPEATGGIYTDVNIFERSILPSGKAANSLTGVLVTKEFDMNIKPEKMAALKNLLGNDHDAIMKILGGADAIMKEAAAQELTFKEFSDKVAKDLPEGVALDVLLSSLKELGIMDEKAAMQGGDAAAAGAETPEEDAQDTSEGDAADEEDDAAMVMGNMTPKEFSSIFVEPITKAIATLGESLAGAVTAQKAADPAGDAVVKALKELDNARLDIDKRIKALEGDTPTRAASASGNTQTTSPIQRKSYAQAEEGGEVVSEDDQMARLWVTGKA